MNEDIYSDINELVINCQNGDNSALFKLYEYYKPLILASVSRCISKEPKLRAYREDIFKECIFVLKKLVDQYDPNLTYFSYFLSTRIDINLFRHVSNLYESTVPINEDIFDKTSNSDPFNKIDNVIALHWAMDQLNEKQREAVDLYFFQQLDQEEAAELLGINQSSFSKRLTRALERLKELLGQDFLVS